MGIYFRAIICQLKLLQWKSLYRNRFVCGKKIDFGKSFSVHLDASGSVIQLGDDIVFRDFCQVRSGNGGKVTLGKRNFFNNHCSINCLHEIIIGDDCQFGEGVKFYDHNHEYRDKDSKISEQGYTTGSIRIGNNCWLGTNVVVLRNVEIGDNVIIGAGCVIHQSVPSGSIIINQQNLITKQSHFNGK